jgi:hypothetical protein
MEYQVSFQEDVMSAGIRNSERETVDKVLGGLRDLQGLIVELHDELSGQLRAEEDELTARLQAMDGVRERTNETRRREAAAQRAFDVAWARAMPSGHGVGAHEQHGDR